MDMLDIFIFLEARGRVNLAALELQLVAAGGSDHCGFMFGSRYVMLNQIAQSCRAKRQITLIDCLWRWAESSGGNPIGG